MADPTPTTQSELEKKNKKLEADLAAEKKLLKETLKVLEETKAFLENAEGYSAKLKEQLAAARLDDNTASVGGQIVQIERTIQAKFVLDEVKKGFLEEDIEVLVPKRG